LEWLIEQVIVWGYLGLFLFSLITGFLVFMPEPYAIPAAILSIRPEFNPTLVALATALGSTTAKTVIFRISYEGRRLVSPERQRRLKPFERLVSRYGWLAAFLAAATPIPDDLIYIPLGFAHYRLTYFLMATLSGKFILTNTVTWGARFYTEAVLFAINATRNPLITALTAGALVVLIGVVVYTLLTLDWEALLKRWFPWTVEDEAA
jgi:membrane protein DedA with SNARE-associated domain